MAHMIKPGQLPPELMPLAYVYTDIPYRLDEPWKIRWCQAALTTGIPRGGVSFKRPAYPELARRKFEEESI